MAELIKKLVYLILTVAAIILIGYGAYVLYNIVMTDATKRIKTGVSEGVSEGIGSGIGNAVNPVKLIGGVLGGGK